uniref:Ig-like domain-containing protein n=1 Tax=Romanomermis culicivorax TaxID=13658 RepID=A0A915HEL6_ROMCU
MNAEYSGQWPRILDVPERSAFSLQCTFAGSSRPSIFWTKDGRPVQNDDSQAYADNNDDDDQWFQSPAKEDIYSTISKLNVRCADFSSTGRYQCIAATRMGNVTSPMATNVRLHENGRRTPCFSSSRLAAIIYGRECAIPEILSWTDTVTTTTSHDSFVRLTCRAIGNPRPKITWFNGKTTVKNDDDFMILTSGDLIIKSSAIVTEVMSFTCKAESVCGADSIEAIVIPVASSDNDDENQMTRFLKERSS